MVKQILIENKKKKK